MDTLTMHGDVILYLEGAGSLAGPQEGVGLHLGGVAHIHTVYFQNPISSLQDSMPRKKT